MSKHVDAGLAVLQHEITNQWLVFAVFGSHLNECYFVMKGTETFDLNTHGTAYDAFDCFLVAVSISTSVMVSRFPSRSRHAIGSTMNDAPVSTNALHLRPLDKSEALSILTEATILPIFLGLLTRSIYGFFTPFEKS